MWPQGGACPRKTACTLFFGHQCSLDETDQRDSVSILAHSGLLSLSLKLSLDQIGAMSVNQRAGLLEVVIQPGFALDAVFKEFVF
jgi:hypothetical protein